MEKGKILIVEDDNDLANLITDYLRIEGYTGVIAENGAKGLNIATSEKVELVVLDDEPVSLGNTRKLRKSYIWSKKIRLAVYKIITYLPKLISGNYRKKASTEQ